MDCVLETFVINTGLCANSTFIEYRVEIPLFIRYFNIYLPYKILINKIHVNKMNIKNSCLSYFNGLNNLFSNTKTYKDRLICSLKIISLATIIIPLFVGISYSICIGIERIKGRVKVIQPDNNGNEHAEQARRETSDNNNPVRPTAQSVSSGNTTNTVERVRRQTFQNTTNIGYGNLSKAELERKFFQEVRSGNINEVGKLLRHNKDLVQCRDHNGMNALFYAETSEMLEFLLKRNVNPNQKADYGCNGKTPLIHFRTNTAFIKLLLSHGADRDIADNNGWTALRWARRDAAWGGDRSIRDYGQNNDGEECHENIRLLKHFYPETV